MAKAKRPAAPTASVNVLRPNPSAANKKRVEPAPKTRTTAAPALVNVPTAPNVITESRTLAASRAPAAVVAKPSVAKRATTKTKKSAKPATKCFSLFGKN